jgi:hypothetical protein
MRHADTAIVFVLDGFNVFWYADNAKRNEKTRSNYSPTLKWIKGKTTMSEEKIQAMETKSALVEKITFALLPLLFSCVVYLMSALSNLSHEVTILNSKISLVVTSDNKQASNTGAELAREKLRQDLEKEIQKNRDDIQVNRLHIAILEDRAGMKTTFKKEDKWSL